MIERNRNKAKRGLFVASLLLLGITVLIGGCGKKEAPEEGKAQAVQEPQKSGGAGSEGIDKKEEWDSIALSPEMQKSSGIEVKRVVAEEAAVPLSATAVIEMNMDRTAKIGPRVTGKAVRIIASQGDRVKAGQVLAYVDSGELDQMWADYRKVQWKVALARKSLQREETLFEQKVSPEKDVLKARQELGEAEIDLNLAGERLRLVGVDATQFNAVRGGGSHPLIPVASPVGGVVIEKSVTQGEIVNAEKTLFMVADLSALWVVIDVYEKDMSRFRVGTQVKVQVAAFPERVFHGKISYIADVVDEKTRTEKARVTIDNVSGMLKPGMFATVLMEARKGGTERLIAVPEETVMIDGTARYVFVQVFPGKFKRREIETGRTLGKRLEVTSGLKEGEVIAIKGAFILKSELKKGENEGAGH
jgi:membrane fusion protein, heavy metal efflux system